jgi:UDP-N-acetylmuramate--alanine ligase
MMVQVSLAAGRDDGWLVGAPVVGVGANGHWGRGDLIVEVDESYGTFELVEPYALGVTSIEADHLDYYGSLTTLETAFGALVERTRGPVVLWNDDEGVGRVRERVTRGVTRVGTTGDVDWRVSQVQLQRRTSSFVLESASESLSISLRVTGAHNVANAAVVAALARELCIERNDVQIGLSNFVGAPRRYQYRGAWRGVDVYEDYAHLPGEIGATLRTVQAVGYERVTVVFQPHRVTRTLALFEQLAGALDGVNQIVITDLYSAGEGNPDHVTGEIVAQALQRRDAVRSVRYCEHLSDVAGVLEDFAANSDVILVLGAGDVGTIIDSLREELT